MNRREIFRNLGSAVAFAGIAAVANTKKVLAQTGCGPVQHFQSTLTQTYQSQCSQQTITATLVFKTTVESCTNADGSVTYTIHAHWHGTAQGYDPITGQTTDYVVNAQEYERTVVGPANGGACTPESSTTQYRELFISKGSAPNEEALVTQTFSIAPDGAFCIGFISYSINTACHGYWARPTPAILSSLDPPACRSLCLAR